MLHKLPKIVRRKKRLGRGIGSRGAKSGRGMKGQKSRAGSRIRKGFEGGQTPLYRRLPKERGRKRRFSTQVDRPVVISLKHLRHFKAGSIVGPGMLRKHGQVTRRSAIIKIIGGGSLSTSLTVRVHAVTPSAREQIESVGGKVEIISQKSKK